MKSRQKTISGTHPGASNHHDTIPRAGGTISGDRSRKELESMKIQH